MSRNLAQFEELTTVFSGIVESLSRVSIVDAANASGASAASAAESGLVRIHVRRPLEFTDLRPGDSIATDGICLTIESFDDDEIVFALGHETLKITGWSAANLANRAVNLERSLRFGDRMHGHMVSGHVDATGVVVARADLGGSWLLDVEAPAHLLPYVWKKGSWAVNGVSLTINDVVGNRVSMCLIPETLKRTNLGSIEVGAVVNLEIDPLARGLIRFLEASPAFAAGHIAKDPQS